jgi:hypothetical protein
MKGKRESRVGACIEEKKSKAFVGKKHNSLESHDNVLMKTYVHRGPE